MKYRQPPACIPVRGRVLELRREGGNLALWLAVEGRLERFLLPEGECAPPAVGDLVAVEAGGDRRVRRLTRIGGPAPGAFDPAGDALRWRAPGASPSRMERLWARQAVVRAVREKAGAEKS